MGIGITKRRTYFTRDDWRERVNPAYVEYWSAKKTFDLVCRSRNEISNDEYKEAWKRLGVASRKFPPDILKSENSISSQVFGRINAGLDGFDLELKDGELGMSYATSPESTGFFRMMVFLKFGITFRQLVTAVDLDNDLGAYQKLQRVHRDVFRLKSGKTSFDDLKLKFSFHHFALLVQGMDLGLNSLNPRELSKCFDEICSCPRARHSEEYMKKLRTNIRKAVQNLLADKSKTYRPLN